MIWGKEVSSQAGKQELKFTFNYIERKQGEAAEFLKEPCEETLPRRKKSFPENKPQVLRRIRAVSAQL